MAQEFGYIKFDSRWVGKNVRINTRPDPKGVISYYKGQIIKIENGILYLKTKMEEVAIFQEGNIGMIVFDSGVKEDDTI